ncbi:MAG: hypothetical protein ACE5HV_04100 [Acidobacteriota bacterium]
MSLKAFHIFFIGVSILLTAFVGGWGLHQYLAYRSAGGLILGGTFFLSGVALVVYLVKFFHKLSRLDGD